MESVQTGGAPAPVENVNVPAAAPEGAAPEAVTPAAAAPAAKPEGDEPKGVAKRIKELSTDRNYWRDLAMRATAQPPAPAREPAASDEDMPVKSLKDFNYDDKAFDAYTEQRIAAKAEKAAKAAAQRYRAEAQAIERRAKFDERVDAFAKTVEDYHDVVTDSTPVSEGMADALLDSDEAGAIMYYLGNNPDVARKLYQMSPARAGKELQKLEDRLVSERKKAAEKPVSQAPPPAPKIDGSGDAVRVDPTSPESDELSDAEWLRKREKQIQSRRK